MRRRLLLGLVLLLIVAVGAVGVWRLTRRAVTQELVRPQEEQVDLTAVVTQVRELSRLETASMRVVHVSTITQSYKLLPNQVAGDQLTFLAAGDVIAGIDLAAIRQEDVWRDPDGTVVLRLPPAQILVSRLDNRESRVLTRTTGMLRRADVNLESRARQGAEQGIRREAVQKGILRMAANNAETKLAQFVRTLGAEKVRFVSPAPAPGATL